MARTTMGCIGALLAGCAVAGARPQAVTSPVAALMPHPTDTAATWWVHGFPPTGRAAAWWRCLQTGTFAFVLDTETLQVPHFGALADANAPDAWQSLPPAELTLEIEVGGTTYRCTAGGKWSRWGGPRLIDAGRFFQRADVTGLVFTADDGTRLAGEARFETAAWPDRLTLLLAARPPEGTDWQKAALRLHLRTSRHLWLQARVGRPDADGWYRAALIWDPVAGVVAQGDSPLQVTAQEAGGGQALPVAFDPVYGWHRVDLDGVTPQAPAGQANPTNDALERIRLHLANPTDRPRVARLLFAKGRGGFRQRIGSAITGIYAVLRDAAGRPTGIPVQLSKNWHTRPEGGVYRGPWFHGLSQVRLPAGAAVDLELVIGYGHWGGVPAVSHAQLCLVGWGSNQHWSQAALGAWGESLCFEPDQVQARCTITDVRPALVAGPAGRQWAWTSNVGGGDFFRLFDPDGAWVPHTAMRTTYHRYGPCLTEVTFAGRLGEAARHTVTVSLGRTDDLVRGVYRIRLDVDRPLAFSRFVIFQIGADTYSYTQERSFALGHAGGLVRQWAARWGGNTYRTPPRVAGGRAPWVSLHEAVPGSNMKNDCWADRGLVIRAWRARLGGRPAEPWVAERGLTLHRRETSTIDLVPPPDVARLEPGDFVEATIEHLVIPQRAEDYYGPNAALRAALARDADTWRMVWREARDNDRHVQVETGRLVQTWPDVRVEADGDRAAWTLDGGLAYVPVTVTGLSRPTGYALFVDGRRLDQAVHGQDFWQTDYDPVTGRWSRTYNVPTDDAPTHRLELRPWP